MPPQRSRGRYPSIGKILLGLLAVVYVIYLVGFGRGLFSNLLTSSGTILDHSADTDSSTIAHWTTDTMLHATGAYASDGNLSDFSQGSVNTNAGQAASQDGQPPQNTDVSYPLSTVGKLFFTNASGQDMVCSGTAIQSENQNTVDTAGHCLYWNGSWVHNVIFCPLYDNGDTPYGCWSAHDLEVPADWSSAGPNDLHHDMGMAIVSPNSEGNLTDVVGGAGWTYNQPITQPFSAYGYPAGYPYNGQTRQSCENQNPQTWNHAGGKVISIACKMTGGSSGGPWFIKINDKWYLNGHNDFTSTIQPGHMFSPYYDDTWYALYVKASHT